MKTQAMGGEIFVLEELDFDAGLRNPTGDASRNLMSDDCGMTILGETAFDAATPEDSIDSQVEKLARLILTSANPAELGARVQTLLRDQLAHPIPRSTGHP